MTEKKENQMDKIKEYDEVKKPLTVKEVEEVQPSTIEQLWANYGKAQARREILAQELEQIRQFMARTYQDIVDKEKNK